jgi:hypothetical protein
MLQKLLGGVVGLTPSWGDERQGLAARMRGAALAAALASLALGATPAAAVTYNVDLTLDDYVLDNNTLLTGGSVILTGQIVTDGTIGLLAGANFLSWSFTVADSTSSGSLSSAGPGTVETGVSSLFTATATELIVAAGNWHFRLQGDPVIGYFEMLDNVFYATVCTFGCPAYSDGAYGAEELLSGSYPYVLGMASSVAPVPLPAALPLFGTGIALLGLLGWRRRRAAAA